MVCINCLSRPEINNTHRTGISDGINPAYLARQLGHSLQVFFEVYATWLQSEEVKSEREKREAVILARTKKCGKNVAKKSCHKLI